MMTIDQSRAGAASRYRLCVLVLFLLSTGGCTLFNPAYNYYYRPTIADRALQDKILLNDAELQRDKKDGITITDVDVFTFMYDLKQAWRQRSQSARTGGAISGVATIGLSAAATTAAATHGGTTGGNTVPILTGIGTFIGELFGLVDPGGRDAAYKDGIKLLLDAETEYCEARVKTGECRADGTKMTDDGAILLKRTNAAIVLVDKALEGRVPTRDQVEAASARISNATATIFGVVTTADDKTAPGAVVKVTRSSDSRQIFSVVTKKDGSFSITSLVPDKYSIQATSPPAAPSDAQEFDAGGGAKLETLLKLK